MVPSTQDETHDAETGKTNLSVVEVKSNFSCVDISLYIDSEREQSPLSDDTKYWLLTATLKHMDAQGHSNIV